VQEYRRVPDRVRNRGHAVTFGLEKSAHLEAIATRLSNGDPDVSQETLREVIMTVGSCYNPESYDGLDSIELRSLSAPVFRGDGKVAFTLTLWGPPGHIGRAELEEYTTRLGIAAAAATASINGLQPKLGETPMALPSSVRATKPMVSTHG
jgi:hypothetical protein